MNLTQAPKGEPLRVVAVAGASASLARRLQELGLRPGAIVQVLRGTAGRGAVVAVADDRLALARSVLTGITVTRADEPTSPAVPVVPTASAVPTASVAPGAPVVSA